jgi:hypothetical protein
MSDAAIKIQSVTRNRKALKELYKRKTNYWSMTPLYNIPEYPIYPFLLNGDLLNLCWNISSKSLLGFEKKLEKKNRLEALMNVIKTDDEIK